jgi:transcriptional regulator GlxA family with amidase domain
MVLLYDGVNAVDVAGPGDAFAAVRNDAGEAGYALTFVAPSGGPVVAESGLRLLPESTVGAEFSWKGSAAGRSPAGGAVDRRVARCDTLLVPGGRGVREPGTLSHLATWIERHHVRFERIVAVCTGAWALAEAGLLDGRRVTTHWAHADALQAHYPKLQVDSDALFLRDGSFFTSGGVTAGIDLALELIAEDFGHETATRVAREMVVYTRRSGKQAQFSAPLRLMARAPERLAEVGRWAANHLDADLRVPALARRAHLSPRQFSRRFREVFGEPPGSYVRRLRLDGARVLLEQGVSVRRAAPAVGFASVDGFRRAFERAFGVTPREYRERFRHGPEPPSRTGLASP